MAEGGKEKKASKPKYDFSGEQLHFESPPHRGDLAANIALGATLLWLPLTIAAVTRAAFVKYRFTDKRISVITSAPWKSEFLVQECITPAAVTHWVIHGQTFRRWLCNMSCCQSANGQDILMRA